MRTPVTVNGSDQGSPLELMSVCATDATGRRFWYCYPDGKPRNGIYLRELTLKEYNRLCDGIRAKGGIDTSLQCWQEGDSVYGSLAYELSGIETQWIERERQEAAWM